MVYVCNGDVITKRSAWRLSALSDVFWGTINIVGVFFRSLFTDPSEVRHINRGSRETSSSGGGSDQSGPRRPMGRINHSGPIQQPMGCASCG
uniref:AlNc14C340G10788 protein n=1 Tax=Albugo laibachii Nc14 TaxID=890382 RepID=F0WX31_9STRA|nr:AlNc14C340G10788 [Albugo laibachii Nc14]|eukprot:CCA26020.1 AlNc14C340G10788 [Albugo laibachii Nc14]